MRRLAVACAVAAALMTVGPVAAQTADRGREALQWLQDEPVSLLDWGMMRLERDLDRTVAHLTRSYMRLNVAKLGVFFRFADRRVLAYVRIVDVPRNRTAEACRDIFQRVAADLTGAAPQGAGGASWYLESVFGHDSRRGGRPQNLGDDLVERVHLQVSIGPAAGEAAYGDSRRVTCSGPFDARDDAIALRTEG